MRKGKNCLSASDAAVAAEFLVRRARQKRKNSGEGSLVTDMVYQAMLHHFGVKDRWITAKDTMKQACNRAGELQPTPFSDDRDLVFHVDGSDLREIMDNGNNYYIGEDLGTGIYLAFLFMEEARRVLERDSSKDCVMKTALELLDRFNELDDLDFIVSMCDYMYDYILQIHESCWVDSWYLAKALGFEDEESDDEDSEDEANPDDLEVIREEICCVMDVARVVICLKAGFPVPDELSEHKRCVLECYEKIGEMIRRSIHVDGLEKEEEQKIVTASLEFLLNCFADDYSSGGGFTGTTQTTAYVCHISKDLKTYKEKRRTDCSYPFLGQLERLYNHLHNPSVAIYSDGSWNMFSADGYFQALETKNAEVFLYRCPVHERHNGSPMCDGAVMFPWFRLERIVFRVLLDDYLNYIAYVDRMEETKEAENAS